VFFVALRRDLDRGHRLADDSPSLLWTTDALKRSYARLPSHLKGSWRWWRLPAPPLRNVGLSDLIIDEPTDVEWHPADHTQRLLAMMSRSNLAKVDAAKREGKRIVGTIYRRTRRDEAGAKVQRAEVRFDDISGCLRTPAGGSSRQTIMIVEGELLRTRLLSAREAARLMGLADDYRLPLRYNDGYHLVGDGVVAPVVRHLAIQLLNPLLDARATSKAILIAAE
jgi:DNA (cytosine-5)-methyltransferase 1